MDQQELIKLFKNGDKSAFKKLYEDYWKKVYDFVSLYIRDKNDIQDVIQDIFIKVWESKDKINEESNFDGYLFIITRNYIFNKKKSFLNKNFVDITLLNVLDQLYDAEEQIHANDLHNHIDNLIESMPSQQKRIFILSRKEYKSYKEISMLLGVSEKTVEYHLSQAVKFLKSRLKHFLLLVSTIILFVFT